MRLFPLSLLLSVHLLLAQSNDLRQHNFNVKNNIALEGYDPVSYFAGQPAEGNEKISFAYKGITYFFSTLTNANKFKTNPASYEPAYGGWCAYAMGESGEKVKIDPETYKIVGGKLYLFYNFWGNNTLKVWNKNENKLKLKADNNWKKIVRNFYIDKTSFR
ncbi:MAG: YHS domain protein [Bacteroidetes bacterium]|nr:YHS domain protein [Bacteroidota bacterium]